jgi:hypothetical protein
MQTSLVPVLGTSLIFSAILTPVAAWLIVQGGSLPLGLLLLSLAMLVAGMFFLEISPLE